MMEKQHEQQVSTNHYGRFTAAVMVYVVGIAAFAVWTCIEQLSVIEHRDPSQHATQVFLIEGLQILFLLAMSVPLIASYHRAKARSNSELDELHEALHEDFRKLQEREKELEDAIHDLERFNALATGREERIIELKNEVNTLLQEMNRTQRYSTGPDE